MHREGAAAKVVNLVENLVCSLGPREGLALLVVGFDVLEDCGTKLPINASLFMDE